MASQKKLILEETREGDLISAFLIVESGEKLEVKNYPNNISEDEIIILGDTEYELILDKWNHGEEICRYEYWLKKFETLEYVSHDLTDYLV